MTIIAYDGTTLVADGRCTDNGGTTLVSDNHKKLYKIKVPKYGKCVLGVCGSIGSIGPWLEHLETKGLTPLEHFEEPISGSDDYFCGGLLIDNKGRCFAIDTEGAHYQLHSPYSIGSGKDIAQHYLVKGYDALTAVLETCLTELTCGGDILVYDWKTDALTEIPAPKPRKRALRASTGS